MTSPSDRSRPGRSAAARPALEPLPIDSFLPELVVALTAGPNAVLRAPTGAGKTTRVPPAMLDRVLDAAGDGSGEALGGKVVVLEPRRVAARAAARRIAEERRVRLGEEVGYRVRFDHRAGAATRIEVVTDGVLLQRLQADPFLDGIGALVFDEFHERRLPSDLALAMARRVQREVRPELKLVVMSATLEPGPLAEFLGGCPAVESEGRLHPVTAVYADPTDRRLGGPPGAGPPRPHEIAARTARGVARALDETAGDVLAFLPGVGEIRRCERALGSVAGREGLLVAPLYGDLPLEKQDAALRPAAARRVVLATNVAETSVTVEGIEAVVDSGYARVLRYDPSSGLDRLELARVSRSSAEQRAGRAGRQGPGRCYRLWTEHEHRGLLDRETPEVARVDLASPALQLLAWGESDLATFGWFEPPEPATLDRALALLTELGALGSQGLTRLGREMAALPVHPRLARLLLAGRQLGVARRAALAAALAAERDPFRRSGPPGEGPAPPPSRSDLLDRLEALEAFEGGRRWPHPHLGDLNRGAARFLLRSRDQLAKLAAGGTGDGGREGSDDEALLRAVFAAYPDRLCRRREPGGDRALMVGGRGVLLGRQSAVRTAELFVAVDLDDRRAGGRHPGAGAGEALVRAASAVECGWLPDDAVTTAVDTALDPERGRVIATRRRRYRDLVLDEAEVPVTGEAEAARVLAAAAAEDPAAALGLDAEPTAGFLARLRCLAEWRPELELPRFGDDELRQLLPALAAGRRSLAELRRAPVVEVLRGTLSREQLAALERQAPERLEVPSGSRVRLDYEPGRPPVLAVRIQELFGLAETPAVAGGRVPVLLHLLAPNYRPQQVTRDLAGFWRRTYPEVRKELVGRYPKHAWPEDPLAAAPERRPRRKR